MNDASNALLIIVSSVLTLFLIVVGIALINVIQLIRTLKRIAKKAEKIADSAEAVTEFINKAAKKVSITTLLANVTDFVKKRSNDRKD